MSAFQEMENHRAEKTSRGRHCRASPLTGADHVKARRDEVEESWQFIDQLIHAIKEADVELEKYNAGSWGPSSSDLLIANHGSKWNNDD